MDFSRYRLSVCFSHNFLCSRYSVNIWTRVVIKNINDFSSKTVNISVIKANSAFHGRSVSTSCQRKNTWEYGSSSLQKMGRSDHVTAWGDWICRTGKCRTGKWRTKVQIYEDIRRGFLNRGRQTTVGLSKTSIVSPFGRHIFGILRNTANIVIQYYLDPRRLSTDPKIRDLEWLEWLFYVKFYFAPVCL